MIQLSACPGFRHLGDLLVEPLQIVLAGVGRRAAWARHEAQVDADLVPALVEHLVLQDGPDVLVRGAQFLDGTRTVSVTVPSGEYRFRYLATDGQWFDDDHADAVGPHGGELRV